MHNTARTKALTSQSSGCRPGAADFHNVRRHMHRHPMARLIWCRLAGAHRFGHCACPFPHLYVARYEAHASESVALVRTYTRSRVLWPIAVSALQQATRCLTVRSGGTRRNSHFESAREFVHHRLQRVLIARPLTYFVRPHDPLGALRARLLNTQEIQHVQPRNGRYERH